MHIKFNFESPKSLKNSVIIRDVVFETEALNILKSSIDFYDFLIQNPSVCSNSDDILEKLSGFIFYTGSIVCPPDCLSQDDIIKWVKEH